MSLQPAFSSYRHSGEASLTRQVPADDILREGREYPSALVP